MQSRFLDRRFLAYFKDCSDTRFEVVIDSIQRSSAPGFDYFVFGRFCEEGKAADREGGYGTPEAAEEPETTQIWL